MKILDPQAGTISQAPVPENTQPSQPAETEEIPKTSEELDTKVGSILNEALRIKEAAPAPDAPAEKETVDVAAHVEANGVLRAAQSDPPRYDTNRALTDQITEAEVTQEHKDAFIDSLISGERYREDFSLMGGRLNVRIRSRSMDETDAIGAYTGVMIDKGEVRRNADYSSLLRKLLCVAQVERINGVVHPVMETPLFFRETTTGREPPAWEPRLAFWAAKPDALVTAVVRCILEFEARYWHMLQHADDANFWKAGESTGE